jgi:hypothetical protein
MIEREFTSSYRLPTIMAHAFLNLRAPPIALAQNARFFALTFYMDWIWS